ncbi:MAG: hypothetical protein WCI73_18390, partial [Phycisphaerae bacterium]
GIYGIAASAALGPVAVLIGKQRAARSISIVALPVLSGLLVAGHYDPDPGVSWLNFAVLATAPALLLIGCIIPTKRIWVRSLIALLAVSIAVATVTLPTALAAQKAAAEDPYASPP